MTQKGIKRAQKNTRRLARPAIVRRRHERLNAKAGAPFADMETAVAVLRKRLRKFYEHAPRQSAKPDSTRQKPHVLANLRALLRAMWKPKPIIVALVALLVTGCTFPSGAPAAAPPTSQHASAAGAPPFRHVPLSHCRAVADHEVR